MNTTQKISTDNLLEDESSRCYYDNEVSCYQYVIHGVCNSMDHIINNVRHSQASVHLKQTEHAGLKQNAESGCVPCLTFAIVWEKQRKKFVRWKSNT